MRSFISIGLPSNLKESVLQIGDKLPGEVKKVKPSNMHLTLKFLGEIEERSAERVAKILENLEFSSFKMELKSLGVFPSRKNVRVIWVGVLSPELKQLHRSLDSELAKIGFREERFTPHITIARARTKVNIDALLDEFSNTSFGTCIVDSIHLKKSTLTPQGPIYSDLHVRSVKV